MESVAATGPLVVIDGNNLVCRWWAVTKSDDPAPIVSRIRTATGYWRPAGVVAAFDDGASFRRSIDARYKAGRPEKPPGLVSALARTADAVAAAGMSVLIGDGFEADDYMASVARHAVAAGHRCILVTNDADLRQCLVDRRVVIVPKWLVDRTGRVRCEYFNARQLFERFGLLPEQWVDFQTLCGADGVPGAKGIGPATAKRLIGAAGSLQAVLEYPWKWAAPMRPWRKTSSPNFTERNRVMDCPQETPPIDPPALAGVSVPDRPSRVVTLRITPRLHQAVKDAAHARRTSMNALAVAALESVVMAVAATGEAQGDA
jgi:5'-3' exonuclease